jgi:hypothetical protein
VPFQRNVNRVGVGYAGGREIYVPLAQFCCEPKTALKNKLIKYFKILNLCPEHSPSIHLLLQSCSVAIHIFFPTSRKVFRWTQFRMYTHFSHIPGLEK